VRIIGPMNCAGCGFDAPADFAFCPKCGRQLPRSCPGCGAPAPAEFSFCPRCGSALQPGAAPPAPRNDEADRRPATVLFADLSGFTALSERLDPEDVRALQTDLFDALRSVLERHDAFVEKYIGDAVVAVFGAPVAHEDDPERALRAALEMHAGVAALNARWQSRLERPLDLHIGINTGRVVAGHLGSAAGAAYAVTGDAVNVAARLQAAAGPGETLVSGATQALAWHAFGFESAGEIALKGKSEPLAAFRLKGAVERARAGRGLEAHGLAAPMIGREIELGRMLEAFAGMRQGRAQVLSLVGDAGIGKSRLLNEFLTRLGTLPGAGEITLRRTACASHGATPFGVIAQFFRDAYGVAKDDPLEAARRKIEDGLRALGAAPEESANAAAMAGYVLGLHGIEALREIDPERLNRQILSMLRTVIERRLGTGPLLLAVEDLQWADAASIEGLRVVTEWLHDQPLMFIFTCRPSFDANALVFARAAHTTLRLAPLAGAGIEAMLAAFFGPAARQCVSEPLHDQVVRQAGGNPFYLEEMLRELIAHGVLVRRDGNWTCEARDAVVQVPATLEGLLLSRVDRLPAAARHCLQEAAVLGPAFDADLLSAASTSAFDAATLDALCRSELLEPLESPAGAGTRAARYRFTHAIVRDVVYQNLLLRRRTELHGRAGRALEGRLHGRPERLEDLEALGQHFSLGDDPLKGARYLLAAGDWARGVYANDDAVRVYTRALETLQARAPDDRRAQLEVRERLGDVFAPIGRRVEAAAHYTSVRAEAGVRGDAVREARMLRKLAGLHWDAGEREQSLACLDAGLRLLAGRETELELAQLFQERGRFAFRAGDNAGALEWAERALAQAERVLGHADAERRREANAAVAHALNTLGAALARLGRPEDAVVHIERSVGVAQASGLLQAACRGYANLGVLYASLDPGRAVDTCLAGLENAKRIGDLGFQSRLYANLAVAYCALTNQCDAQGLGAAQAAIDLDRQLGQIDHLAVPLVVLAQIHQCHGDPALAQRYYEEALALAEEIGEPQLLFPCYDGLGTLYLDLGDPVRAEEYLVKANAVCERAGLDRDALVVLPFLG
jgi:adenylate cyclase